MNLGYLKLITYRSARLPRKIIVPIVSLSPYDYIKSNLHWQKNPRVMLLDRLCTSRIGAIEFGRQIPIVSGAANTFAYITHILNLEYCVILAETKRPACPYAMQKKITSTRKEREAHHLGRQCSRENRWLPARASTAL